MTRRRATRNAPNQQREVDIGSRPVESRVNKESTPITEVKIPRSQAFWTALPWAIACAVTALWPIVVGQHIFYVATACGAVATFIWMIRNDTEWLSMICAPFVPGVGGFVLWKFYEFVGWKGYVLTVVSGCSVLFWWLFSTASTLTFVQRLGMPMFHQQFHVWKALGNVLDKVLTAAYVERVRDSMPDRSMPQDAPPPRDLNCEFREPTGHAVHNRVPPLNESMCIEICEILLSDDKKKNTYSEANLCGPDKPLPGGGGGREMLGAMREWMIEYGLLRWNRTNGDDEPITTQGVTLTERGEDWCNAVLAPPPCPDEES